MGLACVDPLQYKDCCPLLSWWPVHLQNNWNNYIQIIISLMISQNYECFLKLTRIVQNTLNKCKIHWQVSAFLKIKRFFHPLVQVHPPPIPHAIALVVVNFLGYERRYEITSMWVENWPRE
jgi:hypothetical protein